MSLTVRTLPDGSFAVFRGDKIVSDGHKSHSAAWRAADRLEGEAVSPVEKRSDYAFRRSLQQNIPEPKPQKKARGRKVREPTQPRWLEKARRVEQRHEYNLGKFGPASAVRKISVEDYLLEIGKPK